MTSQPAGSTVVGDNVSAVVDEAAVDGAFEHPAAHAPNATTNTIAATRRPGKVRQLTRVLANVDASGESRRVRARASSLAAGSAAICRSSGCGVDRVPATREGRLVYVCTGIMAGRAVRRRPRAMGTRKGHYPPAASLQVGWSRARAIAPTDSETMERIRHARSLSQGSESCGAQPAFSPLVARRIVRTRQRQGTSPIHAAGLTVARDDSSSTRRGE